MADESAVIKVLLLNIDQNIEVTVEKTFDKSWGKSLANLPTLTIWEIELHRQKNGKQNVSIIKTFDKGRKLSEERYISSDSVFTAVTLEVF